MPVTANFARRAGFQLVHRSQESTEKQLTARVGTELPTDSLDCCARFRRFETSDGLNEEFRSVDRGKILQVTTIFASTQQTGNEQ